MTKSVIFTNVVSRGVNFDRETKQMILNSDSTVTDKSLY